MKQTDLFHRVPCYECMELYCHSPILYNDVVCN